MDRQLVPPLRLEPVSSPTALTPSKAHTALSHYLASLPPSSTSRSQLERLVDSLGVDLGLIAPDESQRREEERRAARAERKAERRRERERAEIERMEAEVEGLSGVQGGQGEEEAKEEVEGMEEGAVEFAGETEMGDRGDVEYGDAESADEDEPDAHDQEQEKMDVDMWYVSFANQWTLLMAADHILVEGPTVGQPAPINPYNPNYLPTTSTTHGPLPSARISSTRKNPQPFISPVLPADWHCQKNAISSSIIPGGPAVEGLAGLEFLWTAFLDRVLAFWSARSSLGVSITMYGW